MRTDLVIDQQPCFTKWPEQGGSNDIASTSSANNRSTGQDWIEIEDYQVVPYRPLLPIENESAQSLTILLRRLPNIDSISPSRVAKVYQKYANNSLEKNVKHIDIRI